ncbi:phosphoesterase family-domain-containing protein [Chytriomyces sp. MP71]|nr:phosphoesterase family-domain-containing protein [Chytriomyces sp. MP71]
MVNIIPAVAIALPLLAAAVAAGSLADIEHVVLFMQENRAFDHYFGTMAGVRGFSDPNAQVNPSGPVWKQSTVGLKTNATYLLPWYLNYQGGAYDNATQCMYAGSNGWVQNHAALNGGLNDKWAANNTAYSWGYYKRRDIPVHFALAEGWTVGDMYQEGVIAATNPNRATWASGSIVNNGAWYIDNNETPGCEKGGFNCYPLTHKTTPEYYEDAGVSWSIFQDEDNFDDNPLAWFKQFQDATANSSLTQRGMVGGSLNEFYARAKNGTLPAISYIIGPTQLSEHTPYSPRDGAWLTKEIVNAITQGAGYNKTALFISFDETGGWGDHVTPYHSPNGTKDEWLDDPNGKVGYTFTGPGFRLPFTIISPWTRGGNVFTEHSDHNSQILFIEEWLAAKGKNVKTTQMVQWRRDHMSNLVSAFDFNNPDYSLPALPDAPAPHKDSNGQYDGSSFCAATYKTVQPTVPFDNQIDPSAMSTLSEDGFKAVRGSLTEGRYLTFEANGVALANILQGSVVLTASNAAHDAFIQRWIVHAVVLGGNSFTFQSAVDSRYIGVNGALVNSSASAATFTVTYKSGAGHAVQGVDGTFVAIDALGALTIQSVAYYFKVFSVTYKNTSIVIPTFSTATTSTTSTATTSTASTAITSTTSTATTSTTSTATTSTASTAITSTTSTATTSTSSTATTSTASTAITSTTSTATTSTSSTATLSASMSATVTATLPASSSAASSLASAATASSSVAAASSYIAPSVVASSANYAPSVASTSANNLYKASAARVCMGVIVAIFASLLL